MAAKPKSRKRNRGRPLKTGYAPRVDATAEEIAQAMLSLSADHEWDYLKNGGAVYACESCGREVSYPETLYRDSQCEKCHSEQS